MGVAMKYFAHTETNVALEPQPANDAYFYVKIVGGGRDTSAWKVEEVPEGTKHGAVSDGNGGWNNPMPASENPHDPIPKDLSGGDFHDYCATALGAANNVDALAGLTRMGDIIGQSAAVEGGLVRIAYERYKSASAPGGTFTLSQVTVLLAALVSAKIVTENEETAIVTGWPTTM